MREHIWKDVMAFTKYETEASDYSYKMNWRTGTKTITGEGKRLASSQAWSGLGKKAKDRTNAKIRDREVRLIDLDRMLPARTFSTSLLRKSANASVTTLDDNIAKAFCYIFELVYTQGFKISEVSGHVNKRCYVVDNGTGPYSSYNAATGEESLISILRDSLECDKNSLVLIDEIEAGLHPSVQRRLMDVLNQISWDEKKQFIITTHSATVIDALPPNSRKFIENNAGIYKVISRISPQAALSKMDAVGHPLVSLYCEDDLAAFLIKKVVIEIGKVHPHFARLVEVIISGPASQVKNDFVRHKFRYSQVRNKIGFAAVIDGDMKNKADFSDLLAEENCCFLMPEQAPEKFLISAYLNASPHQQLQVFLNNDNHHAAFNKMAEYGLAADAEDAKQICYTAFKASAEHADHFTVLKSFLMGVVTRFSSPDYSPDYSTD